MAVGAILGKIFGSGEVIKAGLDLIDDIHVSDEELLAAKAKARVDTLNAYAPFKIAQRVLAFMFAGTFLGCFALVLGLTMVGIGNPDDVRAVMGEFYIAEIMLTIVGFYFCGGLIEGGITAARKKV